MLIRQQILEVIKADLQAALPDAEITLVRTTPVVEPENSINIVYRDEPLSLEDQQTIALLQHQLVVTFEIRAKSNNSLASDYAALEEGAYGVMAGHMMGFNPTWFGLPQYVNDGGPLETEQAQTTDDLEKPAAVIDVNWEVRYRHPWNNPSV